MLKFIATLSSLPVSTEEIRFAAFDINTLMVPPGNEDMASLANPKVLFPWKGLAQDVSTPRKGSGFYYWWGEMKGGKWAWTPAVNKDANGMPVTDGQGHFERAVLYAEDLPALEAAHAANWPLLNKKVEELWDKVSLGKKLKEVLIAAPSGTGTHGGADSVEANLSTEGKEDLTWSACVAQLAQAPVPVPQYLRLSHVVKMLKADIPQDVTRIALAPVIVDVPVKPLPTGAADPAIGNLGTDGTSGEVEVSYDVDGISLRLLTWEWKVDMVMPKFLKASVSAPIIAGWTRNWREGLPLEAGAGLNLLWAWTRKFPATPYNRSQLPGVLRKALCLAHDTADLGLRRSAMAHDAFPTHPWSGTVAESLWAAACPTPEDKVKNDDLVTAVSDAWDQWKGDRLFNLTVDNKDWQTRWEEIVGTILSSVRPELYPNLLRLWKALHPTLVNQDDIFTDAGMQMAAFEEFYRLLQDDSVLVDLFLMQWNDWTMADGNKSLRKSLDTYLGLASPGGHDHNYRDLHGKIRDKLSGAQQRALSLRYGDGLAGLGWRGLAEETQRQSMKDAEDEAAKVVLTKALQAYAQGFPGSASPGFEATLASQKFNAGGLASQDGIVEAARLHAELIAGKRVKAEADVPPLPVPLPNEKRFGPEAPATADDAQFDPDTMSGVIVFARRQKHATDNPPWECPTVGKLVLSYQEGMDQPVQEMVLASTVVVPWVINRSLDVQRRLLDYRGRPLGVRLAETKDLVNEATGGDDALSQSAQALALPGFELRRTERTAILGEHGRAPGLIYDRQAQYQFLFSPVLNGGYLHSELTRNLGGVFGHGSLLDSPNQCCQGFAAAEMVTLTRLMRRSPVGACRVSREFLGLGADEAVKFHHFREQLVPTVPVGVRPIADDLGAYHEGFGQAPRARPATVFLAHSHKDLERNVVNEFKFSLRPPALALGHWLAWVKGAWAGSELLPFIRDVDQFVRGWLIDKRGDVATVLANNVVRKAKLQDPNSFLDDPAVVGTWISVKTVLSPAWQLVVPDPTVPEPVPGPDKAKFLPLPARTAVDTYAELQWDKSDSNLEGLLTEVLQNVTPLVQRSIENAGRARTFVLSCGDAPQPKITLSGDEVQITLPKGGIYEVEIQPVIDTDAKSRFADELTTPESCIDLKDGQHFRLPKPTVRWWVETEPVEKAKSLPPQEEVWKALTPRWQGALLDQTGPNSFRPRGGGLEVALCPRPTAQGKPDLRWLLVGKVEAAVQKWEWNGIPQRGGKLAAAARKLPLQDLNAPEDAQLLHTLLDGEAAAFGEEGATSAHTLGAPSLNPGGVPFTTDFATVLLLQPLPGFDEGQTPRMECVIDDPDPADTISRVPQYCRASATVYSRYYGVDLQGTVKSLLPFPGNLAAMGELTMTTPWRRALLPGMVRELGVPRVKMVMPLMIPRSGQSATSINARRPGFIALLRETLPSPFHQVVAEVVWTRVSFQGVSEDLLLPELGPDPLTSIRGLLPKPLAQPPSDDLTATAKWVTDVNAWLAPLRDAPPWVGQPAGLTYEAAAGSKAHFPNMAVFFDFGDLPIELSKCPAGDAPVTDDDLFNDDFFIKVAFHWEVSPHTVTCKRPLGSPQDPQYKDVPWIPSAVESLRSPSTLGWQLRTVAAFDTLLAQPQEAVSGTPWKYVSIDETSATPCPLSFEIDPSNGSLSLWHSEWRSKVDVKPVESTPGGATSSLVHALLFVAWHEVYDFLSSRYQRAATHLYVMLPGERPFNILSKLDAAGSKDSVMSGQFFLCCFSKEVVADLQGLRQKSDPFGTWLDLLFPTNEKPSPEKRKDGAGQIIRSSLIIEAKK